MALLPIASCKAHMHKCFKVVILSILERVLEATPRKFHVYTLTPANVNTSTVNSQVATTIGHTGTCPKTSTREYRATSKQ